MLRNEFDKSLRQMKICLLSGIKVYKNKWPSLIEGVVFFIYYFNIVILYTVIFAEIYWLIDGMIIGRDFVEMSLPAPCITISILATLKAIPLFVKRDTISQMIDTLEKIHPGYENTKLTFRDNINDADEFEQFNYDVNESVEGKLAKEAFKMLKNVTFLLTWVSVSVLIMFLLAPLLLMYWYYLQTEEMNIIYPFSVKYWFDAYNVQFWPLIYFHQVWAKIFRSDQSDAHYCSGGKTTGIVGVYLLCRLMQNNLILAIIVCVNLFGTETLFYAVCTYLEMHFQILSHNFEKIRPRSTINEEIIANVRKHQLLIHLVDQVETIFSMPVVLHIVSSSLLICLSAFNITVAKDLGSVFAFITFLVLSLSQVSLLCYFGDKLMKSSKEVSGGIYKSSWYEFDNNTKNAVLVIIMRSQKPCKLTACNFADVNLKAFTTILSRSWSYFALLKTIYK